MEKCICCEKEEYSRGLCVNAYQSALRKIKQGKTTWQEMEQQGKCKINRKSKYANSNQTVDTKESI